VLKHPFASVIALHVRTEPGIPNLAGFGRRLLGAHGMLSLALTYKGALWLAK